MKCELCGKIGITRKGKWDGKEITLELSLCQDCLTTFQSIKPRSKESLEYNVNRLYRLLKNNGKLPFLF